MKFNLFGLLGQKNTTADAVATPPARNPPITEEPRNALTPPINLGQIILSMTDAEAKASWERREANEKYSQRRYMIGVALYEAYPDMDDSKSSVLEREFAEMLPDENATNVVISRIKSKQQSPEQILEDLKKNMTVGNVVGVNSPAP